MVKNFNVHFNKKRISHCIFETDKYIYRNGYLCGFVIVDKERPKFLRISTGQISETAMAHKYKT